MSYDIDRVAADYLGYIKTLQAYADNEAHALRLARALEVRVRVGLINRSYPETPHGRGPRIVVQPWYYGNSDVLRHELAHIMLWWSGLEREILEEYGDEVGWRVIENLCRSAVAFLCITPPMVRDALAKYGVSAQAVRHLQKLSGADAETALRRLIYDEPDASRAGFLTSGLYIAQVEQCNWRLPFSWLERVPEPALYFPDDANVSFLPVQRGRVLLGVCWG